MDELMCLPVEADKLPAHYASDFVAEFVVGEDIMFSDVGKEGKDVYVEGFYSCVCRKITEGTGESVGAVRKLVKRFLENI